MNEIRLIGGSRDGQLLPVADDATYTTLNVVVAAGCWQQFDVEQYTLDHLAGTATYSLTVPHDPNHDPAPTVEIVEPPPQEPLTRMEAIEAIVDTWLQRDSEYCVTSDEMSASKRELTAALAALGVTSDEVGL